MATNKIRGLSRLVSIFGRLLVAIVAITAVPLVTRSQITGPLDKQTPLALTPGAPAGSRVEDFANVNLFNGNLNFALPLTTAGGRGEISVPLMLAIERHWQVNTRCDLSVTGQLICNKFVSSIWWGNQQVGYGPGILLGRGADTYQAQPNGGGPLCTPQGGIVFTFTDPSGTEHELRDRLTTGQPHTGTQCGFLRGTNFSSVHGTSITFVSDSVINDDWINGPDPATPTGYLLFPDGVRYRVENGLVMWIRDRNGNKVSYVYETYQSRGRVKTITDPLGRVITVNYNVNDATYGLCDQIVMPGFGTTSRTVSVTKTSLSAALRYPDYPQTQTYGQLFPAVNWLNAGTQFNPSIVSGVYLPNGQSYKFYYNTYGELARIEAPAGEAVDYDYLGGLTNEPNSGAIIGAKYIYRRVVAKRVYASSSNSGSTSKVTSYSRPESWNSTTNSVASVGFISTEDRTSDNSFLSFERHYFYGASASSFITQNPYSAWKDGKEYQTDVFDTDQTTVLRRSITSWQQRAPVSWWPSYAATFHLNANDEPANDPRVVEAIQVIEPLGANFVSKTSAINQQTMVVGFDQHNNQTDKWQYDYGVGAPSTYARIHVHTDYLTTNPANNISYADPVDGTSYAATDVHLRDLARGRQTYSINPTNGTETLVAQSEIRYDEPTFPVLTYETVSSWSDPGSAKGNATTSRNWVDTPGSWLETHTQYDQCGNVRNIWDARDSALTNPSQVTYLDAFSDKLAHNTYALPTSKTTAVADPDNVYGSNVPFTTTVVYDFNTGKPVSVTDPNHKTTSYDYTDPLNRLKQVTLPDTRRIRYNYFDGPGEIYLQALYDEDSSRSIETREYFDSFGRPVRRFLFDGTVSTPWLVTDTYYDVMGRVSKVSNAYRVSNPSVELPPSCVVCRTTVYDSLSRVKILTSADGAQIVTSYTVSTSGTLGTIVTVTDQAGRKRRGLTDALGRLVRVDEPNKDTGNLEVGGTSTSYSYDVLGNLRRVDQGEQHRFFMYDSLGRLVRAKNPEQGNLIADSDGFPALIDTTSGFSNSEWSTGYLYDANGNVIKRKDARNIVSIYAFDALNRNTNVTYANDPAATPAVTRTYDGGTNGLGKLWKTETSGSAASRTTYNDFDALGRLKSQSQQFYSGGHWSQVYTVKRTYDLAGNTLTQTYPSGHTVSYSYDLAGRTNTYTGNLGEGVNRTYANEFQYATSGGLQQERFGTDTRLYHKQRFNQRGQLWDIRLSTVPFASDPANGDRGSLINYYSNNFLAGGTGADNNGNLLRQEINIPGSTNFQDNFSYDWLNRLNSIAEKLNGTGANTFKQAYTYDRWGNRTIDPINTTTNVPRTQFTVNPGNNQLMAPLGYPAVLEYDAAGNQTKDPYSSGNADGERVLDAENRIVAAEFTGAKETSKAYYTYDGDGRRVRRDVEGFEVWQVYGFGGELVAEYPQTGPSLVVAQPQKEYGYRNGQLLVTAEPWANIAWNQPATQTDNFSAGTTAAKAVNGDVDGALLNGSVAATNSHANSWWQVDLQSVQNVSSITVWGRTDCCPETTSDFYVFVSNNAFTSTNLNTTINQSGVSNYYHSGFAGPSVTTGPTSININRTGRYVRVQLAGTQSLALAEVQVWSAAAKLEWLVTDHLGTPRIVVDKTGSLAVVSRHDYLPFGEEIFAGTGGRTPAQGYGATDGVRQKFTSTERESEIGLDYFMHRYYSSMQGRFVTPDPFGGSGVVGAPQSWNKYTYCLNRPFVFTDPSGLVWLTLDDQTFINVSDQEYKKNPGKYKGYRVANGAITKYQGGANCPQCKGLKKGDWVKLNADNTITHVANQPTVTVEDDDSSYLAVITGTLIDGVDNKDQGDPLRGPPGGNRRFGNTIRYYDADGWVILDIDFHPPHGGQTSPHAHWWWWTPDRSSGGREEDYVNWPQPWPEVDQWDDGLPVYDPFGMHWKSQLLGIPPAFPGCAPVRIGVPFSTQVPVEKLILEFP